MTSTAETYAVREGFREMPSVSPGGKPYFYFRRNPDTDHREWILWDRTEKRWIRQDENPDTGTVTTWPLWSRSDD